MKPLITANQPNQACSKVMFNGPSTVCATVSGSLSSFYWDFGDLASASNTSTAYSPSHNYDNSGTYHVKLILDDGQCVADTLYKTITIANPTLNITISPLSQTVCQGQSTTLTASGASGYTWMPGALNGSQVAVSPQINTTYTVRGEDNAGCANKNLATVSVYPVSNLTVNTNPKMVCAGQSVTLTASGASSYTWNTGAQSQSLSVTPGNTIVYTLTSVDSYSCSKASSYTLNVINCTGISGLNENENLFAIYPNPAKEILIVEALSKPVLIELVNSLGQIIYSTKETSDTCEINLQGVSRGIYFIKIATEENYTIKKLVLE